MNNRAMGLGKRACLWQILVSLLGLSLCSAVALPQVARDDGPAPSGTVLLSLEESEALVLEDNLLVLRAEEGVVGARAAVKQAKASILPHLNVSAMGSRLGPVATFTIPTATGSEQITVGTPSQKNLTLSLSQPVYAPGPMKVAPQAARIAMGLTESALAGTRDEVLLQVRKAFFNCLRAKELLTVAEQRQQQALAYLKDAQAYFQAGTTARADVLRAQVEVANAEHVVLQSQNSLDLAYLALKNLLNISQETTLQLQIPAVPKLEDVSLAQSLETAKTVRPELKVADFQVDLARAKESLAAAATKPQVFLSGNRQWQTSTAFSAGTSWSLTLSASMPIFDAGEARAGLARAHSDTRQSDTDRRTLQQSVDAQVRAAFFSLEASRKQIEVALVAKEQAQEALRITQLQYGEGMARPVEVIDAQVALAQAASNYVNSVYDYETAKAELARAVGVRSVDELATASPPALVPEQPTPQIKE